LEVRLSTVSALADLPGSWDVPGSKAIARSEPATAAMKPKTSVAVCSPLKINHATARFAGRPTANLRRNAFNPLDDEKPRLTTDTMP
jgi:hypothetical protein